MSMFNKKALVLALSLLLLPLQMAQAFLVKGLEFEGLSRIPLASVQPDVPVHVGDDLTSNLSNQVIADLFATGYFKNIQLYNQNGTLLIKVSELPTISALDFKGNDLIKTDDLKTAMSSIGLQVGNMFNQNLIDQIKQSLIQEYNNQGKYAVKVNVEVAPQSNNRVALTIDISEGLDAKITSINIVGNHVFSEKTLVKQLGLSTGGIIAFFTKSNVYVPEKLGKALQNLSNYYQDHGYIDFHVNSVEASLDSTHTKAFIAMDVVEGQKYDFSGFALKGDLILPAATLTKLVNVKAGDTYSKAVVTAAQQAIVTALGDQGYAFANVNPVSVIDHKKLTAFIDFYVTPGQKVYVRKLNYEGNLVSNDEALRERMKFVEGSTYSQTGVDDSTTALQRLPYIESVDVNKVPVAGSPNQVDLDYDLKEKSANSISAAIGYSDLEGFLLQTGFGMPNLFGTGNGFNINAQLSQPYQNVSVGFTQPFFTLSGIQQSENFYYTRVDAGEEGLVNYSTNSYGGTLNYAIPISTWNSFTVGGGIDHTDLQQPGDSNSETVTNFINQYGSQYNTYSINLGFSRDSTNNAYFPTHGETASTGVTVALPFSDLNWYKLNAQGTWYHALNNYFTLSLTGSAGYGDGYSKNQDLPFFQNYYGGGWGSVRGYTAGQMGPQDTLVCTDPTVCTVGSTSEGNALGGNLSVYSSVQLTYPVPFMTDNPNLKLITFLDAGNVYNTYSSASVWQESAQPNSPNLSNIAYTIGVGLEWAVPLLGPVGVSFALPINNIAGANTTIFQFTLGTFF